MKLKLLAFLIFSAYYSVAQQIDVNVRAFAEGFFRVSSGKMIAVADPVNYPSICDTVQFGLVDTVINQNIYCSNLILKTDGSTSFVLPSQLNLLTLRPYIRFRNTIKLFSKNAIYFVGPTVELDFTDISFAVNCDTAFGVAKAFSGDINMDGLIDILDALVLSNDISSGATGYINSDLNGDHVPDSVDDAILSNNIIFGYGDSILVNCISTSIQDISSDKYITCFPNPFNEEINIYFSGNVQSVSILNIQGTIIKNYSNINIYQNFISLNGRELSPGIYIVSLMTDDGLFSKKIIKL